MSTPSLGRLLISHITLRGPELAQLYAHIAERPGLSYAELTGALIPAETSASSFGIEEAPLREALNFLLVARLVEQQGISRFKASFCVAPHLKCVPFALLLLHHIQMHHEERQRAPVLIYRQIVDSDCVAITTPDLRDQMERGAFRALFAWTGEKVTFWSHLAHHLGLIRRIERSAELLIVPHPNLVLAALRWAGQDAPEGSHSASVLLDKIDTALFACYTARGRVHRGLAQTLVALERAGQVQITHSADAARSLLVGDRRMSELRLLQPGGGA